MENENEKEMDVDSIEYLLREIPEGQETVFDLLDAGGESVKTIEVRRRELYPEVPPYVPEAPKALAKARSHVFNDVDAFAAYLNREAKKDASLILANVDSRVITAVLNERDTTDREEVYLKAMEHPLFAPWAGLLNRKVDVTEFALFVMQNRRAVVEPDGRELAMIFSQVKMSKAITVQAGAGSKSLNGVMVTLDIGGSKQDTPVDLPETITIEAPLFVGTSPRKIELDLLVTAYGEKVVVYATAADVEQQRIEAFEEMVSKINSATNQLVGLGQVSHRPWDELERCQER